MKNDILSKIALVLVLAVCFSCKIHKQVVTSIKPNPPAAAPAATVTPRVNPVAARLETIREHQTDFNTFSGKAKAKLNIDGNSNDVTLNIRIQKNQRIWVSITALLGIEAARALITPDSILVINRLQGLYLRKPFSYVNNYAGQAVNYKTLESLLIGNAIPELVNDENAGLQTGADGSLSLSGKWQSLIYQLMLDAGYRVTQTQLSNQAAGQSLHVVNSAFVQAGGKTLPSHITIQSTVGRHAIQAELNYSRTEFNQPQDYPFSIPSRFSPAD